MVIFVCLVICFGFLFVWIVVVVLVIVEEEGVVFVVLLFEFFVW